MNETSPISPRSSNAGPSRASLPTGASHESELREWLRLFDRRKIMIIGMGLLAVALTALIVAQMTPVYRASARVVLDTRKFKAVSTEQALSGVDTLNVGALETELEIIKSEDLLCRVVDEVGLAADPDSNGTRKADFLTDALAPIRSFWGMALATLIPQSSAGSDRACAARKTRGWWSTPPLRHSANRASSVRVSPASMRRS